MFKKVKRKAENSKSWRCFVNRVRYIIDQMHPHHKIKKVVQAAINFGCLWGQTANDFIKAVHESQELWKLRKGKSKGAGNPTEDIFFELIYSAPKGLRTTVEQRDTIDRMITEPFRNCPIRRNWHLAAWDLKEAERPENWKPLDDVHYLISARDIFGNATISSRFGNGRETLESWMRRVDEEICDMLNQNREMQYEPVRSIFLSRLGTKLGVKLTKLHEMIAHHTVEPVTRDNLVQVIKEVGHRVERIEDKDKLVKVIFQGRKKPRKYRIEKLLLQIAETQLDIELARPDGNEVEAEEIRGELGGGFGELGGAMSTDAEPGSTDPASSTAVSVTPVEEMMVPCPNVVMPDLKSVLATTDSSTPVPASADTAKSSVAPAATHPPVKTDPAQSETATPANVNPGQTTAATSLVPAIPGSIPSPSGALDDDAAEPDEPKGVSTPSAQKDQPVQQSEPQALHPARKKPRWRPRKWDKNPNRER